MAQEKKPDRDRTVDYQRLRQRAQQVMTEQDIPVEELSPPEMARIIEELSIHQIELEMQNEELHAAQAFSEASRQAYRDLWDFAPVAYLLTDRVGRIADINRAGEILFKKPGTRLRQERFTRLVMDEDRVAVQVMLENVIGQGGDANHEIKIVRPDESFRHCQMACSAVRAGNDRKQDQVQIVLVDISDLRASEERLRLALEGGGLGMWDRDMITDEAVWNRRLYEMLGRDPGKKTVTGETFFGYIHEDDRPRVRETVACALEISDEFADEFRVVREDGQVRWLATSGRVYRDQRSRPLRMTGISIDITAQREAQETLRADNERLDERVHERTVALTAQAEVLAEESRRRQLLSRRLVEVLEGERRAVAMALHDEIGQILTTLKMDLELAEPPAGREGGPETDYRLSAAYAKVLEAIRRIKNISRNLRPSALDSLGLVAALQSLFGITKEHSAIEIHFFPKADTKAIDADTQLALYRIAQESLANVLKHAQATQVFVSLIQTTDCIVLSVEDNGIGFDYEKMRTSPGTEKPLGLEIMQERAVLAGGELCIESQPGKGSQIIAQIPV